MNASSTQHCCVHSAKGLLHASCMLLAACILHYVCYMHPALQLLRARHASCAAIAHPVSWASACSKGQLMRIKRLAGSAHLC
eukprot:1082105-Pelagomonas_calceolata.AAC.2